MKSIFQDWRANHGNLKGRLILLLFRLAHAIRHAHPMILFLVWPYLPFYRLGVEWVLGIELPWKLRIGPGLKLYHGQGLVVNDGSILGANCTLRNGTTIGHKILANGFVSGCPILGDEVDVGAQAVLLGPIRVGNHAVIGAGAVVVKDVPDYAVVVGNPARVIRIKAQDSGAI
ncbi:MAG: serine acetyltransferase [Methylacidiphilales bacterium]|nr:serine acetyltransferase [Candidatus Methylacidiphilales bacterium]